MANESIKFTLSIHDKGTATLKKFERSADRLGDQVVKTDRNVRGFSSSLSKMTAATKSLLGPVAALAGAGGFALLATSIVKTGAHFEQTMATVKGVSRATEVEFKSLTDIAKKMGEQTEWSATQAGEALKFLSMAGFKAKDSVAALSGVLDLATAGGLELGRAADIASNALTAMQMPVSDLGKINDTFIATITRSNVNMEMMAESFKYAAPKAKAYGYEIEDLSAMIGVLGNAGIQGSMAGTQLAFAMGKVSKVFTELGMSGSGKDLIDALEAINKAGWDTDEIMEVFGERGGRAVLVMKDMIPNYRELADAIRESEGAAKRLADQMRSTTLGAFKELMSVIESVKIDAFEKETGSLNEAIKGLTATVRDNKDEWVELGGQIVSVTTNLIEFGAAIGGFVGKGIGGFTDFSRALGLLSSGVVDNIGSALELVETLSTMSPDKALATVKLKEMSNILADIDKQLEYTSDPQGIKELKRLQSEVNAEYDIYLKQLWDIADAELARGLQAEKDAENLERLNKMTETTEELGGALKKNLSLRAKLLDLQEKAGAGTKEQERIKNLREEFQIERDRIQNQIELIKHKKELTDVDDKKIKLFEEQIKLLEQVTDAEIKLIEVKIDKKAEAVRKKQEAEKKKDLQEEKKLAADLANAYRDVYGDLKSSTDKYYKYQRTILDVQYKGYKEFITDKNLLDTWYLNEKKKLLKEEIKDSDEFFAGVAVGFDDLLQEQMTWGQAGADVVAEFASSSTSALSDNFFSVMKGEFKSLGDVWDSLWNNMLRKFSDILGQMAVEWAMKGVGSFAMGVPVFGGGIGLPGLGTVGALSKIPGLDFLSSGTITGPGGWQFGLGELGIVGLLGGLGGSMIGKGQYAGIGGSLGSVGGYVGGTALAGTAAGLGALGSLAWLGGPIGGILGMVGGSLLGDLFGGSNAGMGALSRYATPTWGKLPGLTAGSFFQGPGAGSMVPATTLNEIGQAIDRQYQAVYDSVSTMIAVLPEQQRKATEAALRKTTLPMSWKDVGGVWSQGISQMWVTRENIGMFEDYIAGIPEDIMAKVMPTLTQATGKATVEEFQSYLMEIEAMSQMSATTIMEAFRGTIETEDWAGFERSLRDSIFNSVSEGMIAAVMQSEIINRMLTPVYMGISQALEDLTAGGQMVAFEQAITSQFAVVDEILLQLKPLFDVMSSTMKSFQEQLYGPTDYYELVDPLSPNVPIDLTPSPETYARFEELFSPPAGVGAPAAPTTSAISLPRTLPPDLANAFAWFDWSSSYPSFPVSLPMFAAGTDYVPKTGPAIVHQGERIIPAAENRDQQPIVIHNHLYIDGEEIGNVVSKQLEYNSELIESGRRVFS